MATKSILKNIRIEDPEVAQRLVEILELACDSAVSKNVPQRTITDMSLSEIKEIFDKQDT